MTSSLFSAPTSCKHTSCNSMGNTPKTRKKRSSAGNEPTGSIERLRKRVKNQHDDKKGKGGEKQPSTARSEDDTLEKQEILLKEGHHAPPSGRTVSKADRIDSWFGGTDYCLVTQGGEEDEGYHVNANFEFQGYEVLGDGPEEQHEPDAEPEEQHEPEAEPEAEPEEQYEPEAEPEEQYEPEAEPEEPEPDVSKKAIKTFNEAGRGRKACLGKCGKYVHVSVHNTHCVTTGQNIDVAKVDGTDKKDLSLFPGLEASDIGKIIDGATITSKNGDRTGQTIISPDYSEFIKDLGISVNSQLRTTRVGTLVSNKLYAVSHEMGGNMKMTTATADELDKYAYDAEIFKLYGHVITFVCEMEGESIVVMDNLKEIPIVNGYYADISKFKTISIIDNVGEMSVNIGNKKLLKIELGGWKKTGDDITVVLSARVYNFGEYKGNVDPKTIMFIPVVTLMSYDTFKTMKPCRYKEDNKLMISIVEENRLDSNWESLGFMDMDGWKCKGHLMDCLRAAIENAD